MRRLRVALCVLGLALAAGCGGEEETGADLPDALGYVPADATIVALVPTGIENQQLHRLHRLLEPTLRQIGAGGSLRETLSAFDEETGVVFEREIEPQLGGTLVIAFDGDAGIGVLETNDGVKAEDTLRALGFQATAVDGDTVLMTDDGQDRLLDEAIARHEAGDGFDPATFARALGEEADDDALVRLYASPEVVRGLTSDADLPWLRAVRSVGASVELESDAIVAHLRVATEPDGLDEDDLPLEAGDDAPEVPDVEGALNGANRNQSRTTVFLAQLARRAYPDSRFVREVERLEADLGLSFEEEVLEQFDGPSASVAYESGDFGAVSDIADPERMRALLPQLAPRLPPILRGLEGLGDEALVALLLFAPDAPLVPGALPLLQDGIDVRRLEGDLYRMRSEAFGERGTIVFGLIGDRFVVATDLQRARAAAELEVSDVEDAEGAAVGRTDFGKWDNDRIAALTGFRLQRLGEAVAQLEASTEGLEGELRIEVPDGLD